MKITPKGSAFLLSILKENERDFVKIYISMNDEDATIRLNLLKKEEVKEKDRKLIVENVPLVLSLEDEEALENVTFDEEDGELNIYIADHHGDCCCHGDGDCCHHENEECCCKKTK